MVAQSVFILLIAFESSKVFTDAFTTYCSVPCPFMCPAEQPSSCGTIQLPARRPFPSRSKFYDIYSDYDENPEDRPLPNFDKRQKPINPDPPPTPKPKPKPAPSDDPEPTPKKKSPSNTTSPTIQPSRRFFTSLFSIPGAVVDTLIGGEVVL